MYLGGPLLRSVQLIVEKTSATDREVGVPSAARALDLQSTVHSYQLVKSDKTRASCTSTLMCGLASANVPMHTQMRELADAAIAAKAACRCCSTNNRHQCMRRSHTSRQRGSA